MENTRVVVVQDETPGDLADFMFSYICYVRALNLWFHGAHHLTKGISFSGDHAVLYDKIYTGFGEAIDGIIEKGIGLVGPEVACPLHIANGAAQIIECYPSPAGLSGTGIAAAGMAIVKDFLEFLEKMNDHLEDSGDNTLGLNNQIAGLADDVETYYYLLKQRTSLDLDAQG
jgi:DNA-binding ferritin-like protein